MAAITAAAVGNPVVYSNPEQQLTLHCNVDITALQAIYQLSTGKWALALATGAGTATSVYIATRSAKAGQPLTGSRECIVDGLDVSGMNPSDAIYLSNTAGGWDTAAGTVSLVAGTVIATTGESTGATKNKLAKFVIPLR